MPRRCAHFVPVCLVCAATLGGHFFIARKLDARRDHTADAKFAARLSADQDIPILEPIEPSSWANLGCLDPPLPEETMAALPDEAHDPRAIPRLLATLGYETLAGESDGPADALRPVAGDEPPARPLTRRQREDQAEVRAVIDEEMSEASAEERDIWFEELKSLPAEVVRDLLEVRRQMRVLSPDHPLSRPSPLIAGEVVQPREIAAEPVTRSRPYFDSDWRLSREALQAAIGWANHNIANADTIGYKRIEPLLVDVHAAAYTVELADERTVINGGGCRLATSRIDPRQGELIETGRELDLAIDGPGFFVLGDGDENSPARFTRRGVLQMDEKRRLHLALESEESVVLQPEIIIPAEMVSLKVAGDGTVSVTIRGAESATIVGQIQIVMLEDATQLSPFGHGLYHEALPLDQSSQKVVRPGDSGAGFIRQGFLEASNVDLERERAQRDKWQMMLKLLPVQDVPRTANGANRMPQ